MEHLEYLAYLASTVSPGELARAAARRLVQRATQALHRPPPTEREVLEAFCAEDGRDLALKLAAPRASHFWADAGRREATASAALRVPGLRERVLARAEQAWRRRFDVFGTVVEFGRAQGVAWHLDALHGATFPADADADDPRLYVPGLDPKAPWTLARMEHAVWLAQGVWLSADEGDRARWAHEFTLRVRHFARHNPPGRGVNWASAMEVSLRAANLAIAALMLRHRPELQDPEFALALATSLAAHGRFVEEHLEHTGAVPNNHYVADLVGLLHLGVAFPELPGARGWKERAVAGLAAEIGRQVLDDGFSFEGSVPYHRLATELFTLGWFAAEAGRLDLGDAYRDRLRAMYRAVAIYLAPGGRAPQFGDNDSGRALPLAPRAPLDHAWLLPLGAALFEDPELALPGHAPDEEVVFLLGAEGLDRLERLPECAWRGSGSLPRGGIYVLRGHEAYVAVACGPTGQGGIGGHGHNDKLGIEVHDGDQALIVDPGTYCYTSEPAQRDRFRGTAAHSTLQVAGAEQCRIIEGRPFALPDDARARALAFESSPRRDRFAGEHRGFERIAPGLRHRREVVLDRAARAVLVHDRVSGSGEHEVVIRFQLPDTQARLIEPDAALRARLEGLGLAPADRLVELGPGGAPRGWLAPPPGAEVRLAAAHYSPGYGERRPSLAVEIRPAAPLPVEARVAILLHQRRRSDEGGER